MTVFKGIDSTSDLDYPTITPTLDLNFALTKTLDPRITYSRNSIGTYVGSDGYIKTAVANEPRFDHDPVTGKCLGLLIETSRTNRIANSSLAPVSTLGSSNTIGSNCLVATNTAIAPDGTLTAYTVNPSASFSYVGIDHNVFSVVSGVTYTASIWVKKFPGVTYQNLSMVTNDWASPAVISFNSELNASTDWIRISRSFTSNVTADRAIWLIRQHSNDTVPSQPLYVWGPQIEAGDYPTSYIPTSGSTVTRAADIANITGTNFSSWYNDNTKEGTLYFDITLKSEFEDVPNLMIVALSRGASNYFDGVIGLFGSGTIRYFHTVRSDIPNTGWFWNINSYSNFSINLSSRNKYAVGFKVGTSSSNFAINGTLIGSKNTPFNNVNGLYFGTNGVSQTISRIAYYPKRLPNSQLRLLTQN